MISTFSSSRGRGEGVQGVLILFGRGRAQVCHDLRVEELREQLEVEEKDGDRQEEEVEEKGEVESRRVRHGWNEDDCECAQNLSHEVCGVITNRDCEQCAICADSMHVVRHAIVEVNVVIGVLVVHGELLVVVRVIPILLVMLWFVAHLFS